MLITAAHTIGVDTTARSPLLHARHVREDRMCTWADVAVASHVRAARVHCMRTHRTCAGSFWITIHFRK